MGRAKKTKKFATMKRMISASDPRLKDKDRAPPKKGVKEVGIGNDNVKFYIDFEMLGSKCN